MWTRKYIIIQVVFWLLFYLVWLQVVRLYLQDTTMGISVATYHILTIMAAFYGVVLFITPKKFYKQSKLQLGLTILQIVLICGTVLAVAAWLTAKPHIPPKDLKVLWQWQDLIFNRYFVALLGALAGLGFKLLYDWITIRKNYEQLEKEKLKTELDFLKAQINPHFIFNTINTAYFQISKENKEAREILLTFSELLRFQLYECNADKISIEKEVRYLENYVELQKRRKGKNYHIEFSCGPDLKNFNISPLLMIPIVENAFKYVSANPDQMNVVKITIQKNDNDLVFSSFNTKENEKKQSLFKPEGGIGLANVKRRLDLLYKDAYELIINETENTYCVKLKIRVI